VKPVTHSRFVLLLVGSFVLAGCNATARSVGAERDGGRSLDMRRARNLRTLDGGLAGPGAGNGGASGLPDPSAAAGAAGRSAGGSSSAGGVVRRPRGPQDAGLGDAGMLGAAGTRPTIPVLVGAHDSDAGTPSATVPCSELVGFPQGPTFVSVWTTANRGASGEREVALPLVENGSYDFVVCWGDGTLDAISAWDSEARVHTYAAEHPLSSATIAIHSSPVPVHQLYSRPRHQ
jgi:predicted small secreted protein